VTTPTTPEAELPAETLDTEAVQIVMIAASHGMNTDQYTVPYVATWASRVPGQDPVTTIQQTAARVRTAALQALDRLKTPQVPDGEPPNPTACTPAAPSTKPSVRRTPTRTENPRLTRPVPYAFRLEGPGL
jgi:hypothetical protein